ncbi:MAG: T9SS type A sorting domain-containing protein [bacterium]
MKRGTFLILSFFLTYLTTYSQNSADYFPSSAGYKWNYKIFSLDSLNNPIEEFATAKIDSFAGTSMQYGRESKIIIAKNGALNTINLQPYIDSTFFNFNGSQASVYFSLIGSLDSSIIMDTLLTFADSSLVDFIKYLQSLTDWYPLYDFAKPVNQSYTLFTKDTTITYDSINIPIRLTVKGKRLNDESLQTVLGTYTCKKFELSASIGILVQVLPPPFPIAVLDLLTLPLTKWFAPNMWMLKEYMPNVTTVQVPGFDIPSVTIPGHLSLITDSFVNVEENNIINPVNFTLYQNYPNPFNPETNITFSISKTSKIDLTVFNSLGEKITTLVKKEYSPGKYEIKFNSRTLTSGIYFYTLKTNSGQITKKMTLIK